MGTFRIKLKSCSVCTEGDKGCGAEVAGTRVPSSSDAMNNLALNFVTQWT